MPSKFEKKVTINGKRLTEHRLLAEKVLGKVLPVGVVVHHHTKNQLVICQKNTYHNLLHRRTRALKVCGHASWRKCWICKKYDAPENLYVPAGRGTCFHRNCHAVYEAERRKP